MDNKIESMLKNTGMTHEEYLKIAGEYCKIAAKLRDMTEQVSDLSRRQTVLKEELKMAIDFLDSPPAISSGDKAWSMSEFIENCREKYDLRERITIRGKSNE